MLDFWQVCGFFFFFLIGPPTTSMLKRSVLSCFLLLGNMTNVHLRCISMA